MTKSLIIAQKEIKDFFRDTGDLAFALLLPILIFALMYGVFSASTQFNGTAYIVNEDDGGKYATELINNLENSEGITVKLLTAGDAAAKLDRSAIYLAMVIPSGFSDTLADGQPVQLAPLLSRTVPDNWDRWDRQGSTKRKTARFRRRR